MATGVAPVSQYAFFPAFNNKMPPEGPRYIPMNFLFTTYSQWEVDMTIVQQQGKISTLQAFYIDNTNNTSPTTITMGLGGQVIEMPAGAQGYVTVLTNNVPKFLVSSTQASGQFVNVFALNFPVTNAVWDGLSAGGGGGGNVNLIEVGGAAIALGQAVKASSLPVTLASDQGNLGTNLAQVGGAAISLGAAPSAASVPVVLATDRAVSCNIQDYGGVTTSLGAKASASSIPVVPATDYVPPTVATQAVGGVASTTATLTVPSGVTHCVRVQIVNMGAANTGGAISETILVKNTAGTTFVNFVTTLETAAIGAVMVMDMPCYVAVTAGGTMAIQTSSSVGTGFFQVTAQFA